MFSLMPLHSTTLLEETPLILPARSSGSVAIKSSIDLIPFSFRLSAVPLPIPFTVVKEISFESTLLSYSSL